MPDQILDYRSDTFTKPTAAMRAAMAAAEVGDDVFDEDPTVHRLQEAVAAMLGKEAALFVPSGSMSNQIAVRLHCDGGDEFLCEAGCHIYNYEQGTFAQWGGVVARTIQGEHGVLTPDQFTDMIRPANDHCVRTRLVTLENTHNRGAGRIQPYEHVEAICRWAHDHGLRTHLDGARLWNAAVATGISPARWSEHFDTVSVCFSKGLGAPVGSALAGPGDMIRRARRLRKCLGGGMRQAGIIAAGALYAMENHVARLAEDHAHAQRLAEVIRDVPGLELAPQEIDTNMVIFRVAERLGTAAEFCSLLKAEGVLMLPVGSQLVRAVTHLNVPTSGTHRAGEAIRRAATTIETPPLTTPVS
jgi:threonine aldolase